MALAANADVDAARAAQRRPAAGRDAASRAWLPRVTLEEGWQRGDQPVFVFGSLLAQQRFTEANFAVQSLITQLRSPTTARPCYCSSRSSTPATCGLAPTPPPRASP
jgi:hypothetical protein